MSPAIGSLQSIDRMWSPSIPPVPGPHQRPYPSQSANCSDCWEGACGFSALLGTDNLVFDRAEFVWVSTCATPDRREPCPPPRRPSCLSFTKIRYHQGWCWPWSPGCTSTPTIVWSRSSCEGSGPDRGGHADHGRRCGNTLQRAPAGRRRMTVHNPATRCTKEISWQDQSQEIHGRTPNRG